MLLKCMECGNDISQSAAACPKCGHPTEHQASSATTKKISHSAGWISLASFVLSSFIPAILAPIFVLTGIIFASKELSAGGKKFGTLVLCLSLLQGWLILDHFGHISGSLGLTTAKDIDTRVATQYATVSLDLPSDWKETAKSKCRDEWPSDYRMQEYCVTKQTEGAEKLSRGSPQEVDFDSFRVIRGKCAEEWPRDFNMRAYCEQKQYDGYRSLNAAQTGDSLRNKCAQQWPNDYNMRKYCETKN